MIPRVRLERFCARNRVPAVGAALVERDGATAVEVVGVRVRGGADPVRPEDPWHIGSCAKAMAGALYARLVERGDAEWGARVPELFPDVAVDPAWRAIAIDDVFVAQAGLPANLSRTAMKAAFRDARPLPEQRTEVTAAALARPPKRPGRYLYSNLGYIVIGAAIERITAMPYEEALAEHVLAPLGIASGGFGPPAEVWGHGRPVVSLGPLVLRAGRPAPADPAVPESDNPPVMGPAGRLHLTLADWARFQRVFLDRGGDFLRPATVERLLTPGAGRGMRQAYGWVPARGLGGVSYGQQGSNTYWHVSALIDAERTRTVLVACNDGRRRLLTRVPQLAAQLLADAAA